MTGDGMIMDFMQKINIKWIRKPLFDCPPCMSSFWGLAGFTFGKLNGYIDFSWYHLPIYIIALCGANWFVRALVEKIYDIELKIELEVSRPFRRHPVLSFMRIVICYGGLITLLYVPIAMIIKIISIPVLISFLFVGIKYR